MKRFIIVLSLAIVLSQLAAIPAGAQSNDTKLIPSDGDAEDNFGAAVAIDSNTIVVGARYDDDNGSNSGSAYVFSDNGSGWSEIAKLTPSDGAAGDMFGAAVAIDGNIIVVGARYDDDNGSSSGSAYVFSDNGSGWSETAKLIPGDGVTGDNFGWSVSISGNIIVVGSWQDDDNGSGSGSAYVFSDNGSGWAEVAKLIPSDGAGGDEFGYSVAVSGSNTVVGATADDDNGSSSGSAYVFSDNGSGWSQVAKLIPSDGALGDTFGNMVSIDGNTIVVGARYGDDNGSSSGSAYVFNDYGNSWSQVTKLTPDDGDAGDMFGWSVSISENVIVVGSWKDNTNGSGSGSAYVFNNNGDSWSQAAKLVAGDGAGGDEFGYSVAARGSTIVVGAKADDDNGSNSGSAYVYQFLPSSSEPPVACAGGPYIVNEGDVVSLDASGSYAPDSSIISYEWDLDHDDDYGDATGVNTTVVFDDDGLYTVGLRVTNSHGESDTAMASVTVGNLPPEVNAGPDQIVNLGDNFILYAEFTDAGTYDTHTATIYWNDGSSEAGTLIEPNGGPGSVSGNHNYNWPGVYEITVEVTDDDGGVGNDLLTVDVLALPEIMVEILNNDIDDIELPASTKNSLTNSLDVAIKVLEDSNQQNDIAAINALEAFISKLEAQRGKKIPSDIADMLITRAYEIIASLNG